MSYARTFAIIGATVWFALATSVTGHASSNCPPLASKVVTASDGLGTTLTSYVNVANTAINFVQGGSKAGCVLVFFSAEAEAAANDIMVVHAMLDGVTPCSPDEIDFVTSNATVTVDAVRAMNFICPGVAPGSHVIRMQYRSDTGAGVYLTRRTIIVQFVP
jgi:hypothetical protein